MHAVFLTIPRLRHRRLLGFHRVCGCVVGCESKAYNGPKFRLMLRGGEDLPVARPATEEDDALKGAESEFQGKKRTDIRDSS